MAQKVIAAKDFELAITAYLPDGTPAMLPYTLETGANFNANITGQTDDVGAFSTNEPVGTEQGGTTYDVTFALQEAEAIKIKDAIAAAFATAGEVAPVHIRQLIEAVTLTAKWYKRRDVPATVTNETYAKCTGVEESDAVERRSSETLKTWHFRALSMERGTSAI